MNLVQLFDILASDPVAALKAMLRICHFIGLALGLGAATILDLMVIKFFVRDRLTQPQWEIFNFGSQIVMGGLVLLWATGLSFLVFYAAFDPAKLANEKVWAKLLIVTILTFNGLLIHYFVLPTIKGQIGRSLLQGLSVGQRNLMLISGSVSVTSWYVPLLLGAMPQLNFVVPMSTILAVYTVFLVAAAIMSRALLLAVPRGCLEPASDNQQTVRTEPAMVSLGDLPAPMQTAHWSVNAER